MNKVSGVVLFVCGVVAGMLMASRHGAVVHAQTGSNGSGCMSAVRKDWGKYEGSSLFGLAFEDEKGTLRFVAHPNCGGLNEGINAGATSIADLTIVRQ